MGDAERLAAAALRAGPLSYLGIVRANEEQVRLLEEALAALPDGEDSHLRAMVTARLGLVIVYYDRRPRPGVPCERSLALSNDAVAMARRLGDRVALGLRAQRPHARALGHRAGARAAGDGDGARGDRRRHRRRAAGAARAHVAHP